MSNFEATITNNEAWLRLLLFTSIFSFMALWESVRPCRKLLCSKIIRWRTNLGIMLINSALVRFLFPSASLGAAAFAQAHDWGAIHFLKPPHIITLITSLVILDLTLYWQHRLLHLVPGLWRIHRAHHADLDLDISTAVRFHPIEIVLSLLIKCSVIFLLGPPIIAVLIFEILLNGFAVFNHGNISISDTKEKIIRRLFVTPDMHRTHHSTFEDEHNKNFGFCLSIWDHIFDSYCSHPKENKETMTLGLSRWRNPKEHSSLLSMLKYPFL